MNNKSKEILKIEKPLFKTPITLFNQDTRLAFPWFALRTINKDGESIVTEYRQVGENWVSNILSSDKIPLPF